MNERIKELWEDNDTIEVCYPEQGSPVSVSVTTLEKFAELIIKECVDLVDTLNEAYDAPSTAGKFIKKHFGIEET